MLGGGDLDGAGLLFGEAENVGLDVAGGETQGETEMDDPIGFGADS